MAGNIPTQPNIYVPSLYYPRDLFSLNKNFNVLFKFSEYSRPSVTSPPQLITDGAIALPYPILLNDINAVDWEAVSGGAVGAAIDGYNSQGIIQGAIDAATNLGAQLSQKGLNVLNGIVGLNVSDQNSAAVLAQSEGLAINPFLTMLFKQPIFKQHKFDWLFAPNNYDDSVALIKIINMFKKHMAPTTPGGGAMLGYPNIVQIQLNSQGARNGFLHLFKKCVITSVIVNHSAGGFPAFFNNNNQGIGNAPALVGLQINFNEIEYWVQKDYESNANSSLGYPNPDYNSGVP